MKKTPAGDFSDILAGLTVDGGKPGPGPAQRAAGPAMTGPAMAMPVPDWKANAAARRAKAPAETKRDQDKEKDAASDVEQRPDVEQREEKEQGKEKIETRPHWALKRWLAALWSPRMILVSPAGSPKTDKTAASPTAAQRVTRDAAPGGEATMNTAPMEKAPAGRPRFRLPQFFGALSWVSRKGHSFPKALFRMAEAPKPGRAKRAAPAREPHATSSQFRHPKTQFKLPKTEDEAIAVEMGLHADLASADLKKIRREFAKKNHPDRFEAPQRMSAARRMSIANMLIDEHLKKRPAAK